MTTLLTTGGVTVVAGSTPNLTAELYDNDGTALSKTAITSLTLTIKDSDGNIINTRDAVDINDTGIGSLVDGASTVVLTIKPTAADTAYQGASGVVELHYWSVAWGWSDADLVARTGSEIWKIKCEQMPQAAA